MTRNRWRMHDYVLDNLKIYYPTYLMKMPGLNYVVTVDPANIEYVLKTNFSNYDKVRKHAPRRQLISSKSNSPVFSRLWRLHASL